MLPRAYYYFAHATKYLVINPRFWGSGELINGGVLSVPPAKDEVDYRQHHHSSNDCHQQAPPVLTQ
jgi:hypothetical protein